MNERLNNMELRRQKNQLAEQLAEGQRRNQLLTGKLKQEQLHKEQLVEEVAALKAQVEQQAPAVKNARWDRDKYKQQALVLGMQVEVLTASESQLLRELGRSGAVRELRGHVEQLQRSLDEESGLREGAEAAAQAAWDQLARERETSARKQEVFDRRMEQLQLQMHAVWEEKNRLQQQVGELQAQKNESPAPGASAGEATGNGRAAAERRSEPASSSRRLQPSSSAGATPHFEKCRREVEQLREEVKRAQALAEAGIRGAVYRRASNASGPWDEVVLLRQQVAAEQAARAAAESRAASKAWIRWPVVGGRGAQQHSVAGSLGIGRVEVEQRRGAAAGRLGAGGGAGGPNPLLRRGLGFSIPDGGARMMNSSSMGEGTRDRSTV